ncbi:NAD(P)H-hydrate dehydratase [Thermanaerosceptrum fracticalcis]|jgi:NAD(P)H-hydrate epimerase|uniref:Bifunctional NAD(P)H-hydrate repair enzyme n=2 Tax=Thermanaerosceptrum fracticalcis TaxID=1712410 RepID=A0A7G6E3D6_THEFR|nr:NAD(P)H-hydrate dehydratase [Thermanaerosceptrum fracticalcis]
MWMRIVTGSEMKLLDKWAVEERGIPTVLLMENAGNAIAQTVKQIFASVSGRYVIILVGKGNNGGDALVAARHLHQLGAEVKLFLLFPPEEFQGAVKTNWHFIESLDLKWHQLQDDHSFYLLKLSLNNCDLIIDGIFGTGFRGDPQGHVSRAIQVVNESSCPVLAIDVPSGLDADTGRVGDPCIKANYTVTFAWAKRGLVLYPGKHFVGKLVVADISLPQDALALLDKEEHYIDRELAKKLLPQRDWEGHKNSFGHVLVIAGSRGMTGAALLTSKAVLRAGAGLVTTCLPASLADLFDIAFPEGLTRGMAETRERTLAAAAWWEMSPLLANKKAVVFGPGLSTHPEIGDLLEKLLAESLVPLVIDADGLNVLAQDTGILKTAKIPVILTPHPGEMGRLLGVSAQEVQANRVETARLAADLFQSIIVLKGAATITVVPDGHIFINSSGGPSLATAGSGDVLAGVIASFLAQGLEPACAAMLGVYVHGLAGDLLAESKGIRGVLAGDIVETLPLALKTLKS